MEENKAGGKIVVLAGCKRDWNNPEKTGRTSMKMTAHSMISRDPLPPGSVYTAVVSHRWPFDL